MPLFVDLTDAIKPPYWKDGDPLLIPVTEGNYDCDYDVEEYKLPVEFMDRMKECSLFRKSNETVRLWGDIIESSPVGVNKKELVKNRARLVEA